MTTICALADTRTGSIVLGSNSRCLLGDTIIPGDKSKWIRTENWALAFTGMTFFINVIEAHRNDLPQSDDPLPIAQFIHKAFLDMKLGEDDGGSVKFRTNGILVRRDGAIFDMDNRLSLASVNADTLWANGRGMEYALGAAHVLKDAKIGPDELVQRCLEAAIAMDSCSPGEALVETF